MTVVLADGGFDGLHFGHIAHLREARKHGDSLIVALATDEAVAKRKGPGRPRFPVAERKAMLEDLRFVDKVVVTDDSLGLVQTLKPAIYVKGDEYADTSTGNPSHEKMKALLESYGGQIIYTDTMLSSSSELLNKIVPLEGERATYIGGLKERHGLAGIFGWLDKARTCKACVAGERIVDNYTFVEPRGKSAKESILVFSPIGKASSWKGGASIVRAHLSEATNTDVPLVCQGKPVIKSRYVMEPFIQKVFELAEEPSDGFQIDIETVRVSDAVVVADFGHGLFPGRRATEEFKNNTKFLALLVQTNSLNWGFNLLSKWPGAEYFVCDEMELRLATHNQTAALEYLIRKQHEYMGATLSVVTSGHHGAMAWDGHDIWKATALADRVVDRMGAGDAFYGWTAALAWAKAPADILLFVGSVAAAIEVGHIGNEVVKDADVRRWIGAMLK